MQNLHIATKNNIYKKISTIPNKAPALFLKHSNMDSNYTLSCFCKALTSNLEEAKAYISKNYVDQIDLARIQDEFLNKKLTPALVKLDFKNIPKNCKADTIMIHDEHKNIVKLIHIYMLHEPDKITNWKIYSVEEELN